MDTIKVTNGDYWVTERSLDIVYALYHFHNNKNNLQLLAF